MSLVCRWKDFQNYLEGKIRAITQLTLQQSIISAYILHGNSEKILKNFLTFMLFDMVSCIAKGYRLLISLIWPEAICVVLGSNTTL